MSAPPCPLETLKAGGNNAQPNTGPQGPGGANNANQLNTPNASGPQGPGGANAANQPNTQNTPNDSGPQGPGGANNANQSIGNLAPSPSYPAQPSTVSMNPSATDISADYNGGYTAAAGAGPNIDPITGVAIPGIGGAVAGANSNNSPAGNIPIPGNAPPPATGNVPAPGSVPPAAGNSPTPGSGMAPGMPTGPAGNPVVPTASMKPSNSTLILAPTPSAVPATDGYGLTSNGSVSTTDFKSANLSNASILPAYAIVFIVIAILAVGVVSVFGYKYRQGLKRPVNPSGRKKSLRDGQPFWTVYFGAPKRESEAYSATGFSPRASVATTAVNPVGRPLTAARQTGYFSYFSGAPDSARTSTSSYQTSGFNTPVTAPSTVPSRGRYALSARDTQRTAATTETANRSSAWSIANWIPGLSRGQQEEQDFSEESDDVESQFSSERSSRVMTQYTRYTNALPAANSQFQINRPSSSRHHPNRITSISSISDSIRSQS
eukprot:Partr_v1_DN28652_c2_g1_i4_m49937